MTIYSRHANRGKTQILATYNGDAGVTSSTVTSVDDPAAAAAIVDSLNRISASASIPVSIHDERSERFSYYPREHLASITESGRRADLLSGKGEHGLWYDYALLMLYRALNDLDTAAAEVPAPVRTAIAAELEAEVRGLRVGLDAFAGRESEEETGRHWDFEDPFVLFDGGMAELSGEMRERLDRLERKLSVKQLAEAVEDLRLLHNVYMAAEGGYTHLEEGYLLVSYEHEDTPGDGYYLTIHAPLPSDSHGPSSWSVTVSKWIADDYDEDGEVGSAHGEEVLECALAARPPLSELSSLLGIAASSSGQVQEWAQTPVGHALAGSAIVVTKRHDLV